MSRFSKQADLYVKYRPDYPKELYNFIFEHLSSNQLAWDCATGSGQVAKELANHFKSVIATDISRRQLSFAPKIDNVQYRELKAEKTDFDSSTFDLITVAQAIHWFDIQQFYDQVMRVGKTGALLAVIGYGMVRINDKVNPIIDDFYAEAFTEYFNKNRQYLDNHYQTLPFPFDEIPSPEFSQNLNWSFKDLKGYFNSWSAVQKIKSEQGYNPTTETLKQIRKTFEDPNNIDVSFPVFMRLGRI